LKKYGADHVINYKENPNWGEQAQELTPGKAGVHHVVEVGGPTTMAQSLKAIKIDGVISIIGFIGGFSKDQPTFLDCLVRTSSRVWSGWIRADVVTEQYMHSSGFARWLPTTI
jgi:NADPH:quinone reductase-like Zn-dependent oxidoreductase